MKTTNKLFLGAAVTGLLMAATGALAAHDASSHEKGRCHGVNACRGQGDCHGVKSDGTKYDCKGNNECKGKGYVKMTKSECVEKEGTFESKPKA